VVCRARDRLIVNDFFHWILLAASLMTAITVFIVLFFLPAPYGRQGRTGWGPQIPTWLGWLLMESVSALLMLVMFITGEAPRAITQVVFLLMWKAHYIHRAFIYPFRLRDKWKPMPAVVSLMGGLFNLVNAYLNGRYLFDRSSDRYQVDWLTSPQFIIRLVLFITGFIINRQADAILRSLRTEGTCVIKFHTAGCIAIFPVPTILEKSSNEPAGHRHPVSARAGHRPIDLCQPGPTGARPSQVVSRAF
jgi:hypothetical protein